MKVTPLLIFPEPPVPVTTNPSKGGTSFSTLEFGLSRDSLWPVKGDGSDIVPVLRLGPEGRACSRGSLQ